MGQTILVITVGRREVQLLGSRLNDNGLLLNKVIDGPSLVYDEQSGLSLAIDDKSSSMGSVESDSYVLLNTREDGKKLVENERFKAVIDFPIVRPVVEDLIAQGFNISYVVLVSTNQETERYRDGDTLHFSKLIAEFLDRKYGIYCDEYMVSEQPTDIDFQYAHFKLLDKNENERLLPIEDVDKVILLAQGGIDQVNFALSLRLIETYREKLVYLHKPENTAVQEKKFPDAFIKNLTRNQAISLIENREFKGADLILLSSRLKHLCQLANSCVLLNHPEVIQLFQQNVDGLPNWYYEFRQEFQSLHEDLRVLTLLFMSLRNDYAKTDANNLVWKIQTLAERLFKPGAANFLGLNLGCTDEKISETLKLPENRQLLNEVLKFNKTQRDKLARNPKTVIQSDYKVYRDIVSYANKIEGDLQTRNAISLLIESVNRITDKRKKLIHQGKFTTIDQLESRLPKNVHSLTSLMELFEVYFISLSITRKSTHLIESIVTYGLNELNS